MRHPKQKGPHTWDLTLHYHRCPKCGTILESRDDYGYRLGNYIKELDCYKCGHQFTLQKRKKPMVGPILGEGDTYEIEWEK